MENLSHSPFFHIVLISVCQQWNLLKSALTDRNGSCLPLSFTSAAPVPAEWEDMQGSLVKVVKLPVGSPEFKDVEAKTIQTGLQAKIISVSRCSKLVSVAGFTLSSHF